MATLLRRVRSFGGGDCAISWSHWLGFTRSIVYSFGLWRRWSGWITKTIRTLGGKLYEERLRKSGMFGLGKRQVSVGGHNDSLQISEKLQSKTEYMLLFAAGCKTMFFLVQQNKFRLDSRRNILTVRTVGQWDRLPWEVVESSSLEAGSALYQHCSGMIPMFVQGIEPGNP